MGRTENVSRVTYTQSNEKTTHTQTDLIGKAKCKVTVFSGLTRSLRLYNGQNNPEISKLRIIMVAGHLPTLPLLRLVSASHEKERIPFHSQQHATPT